jgi:hypothetical protein
MWLQVRLDSMRIRPVPFLGSDTPMYDLLRLFQVTLCHVNMGLHGGQQLQNSCTTPLSCERVRLNVRPQQWDPSHLCIADWAVAHGVSAQALPF